MVQSHPAEFIDSLHFCLERHSFRFRNIGGDLVESTESHECLRGLRPCGNETTRKVPKFHYSGEWEKRRNWKTRAWIEFCCFHLHTVERRASVTSAWKVAHERVHLLCAKCIIATPCEPNNTSNDESDDFPWFIEFIYLSYLKRECNENHAPFHLFRRHNEMGKNRNLWILNTRINLVLRVGIFRKPKPQRKCKDEE